MTAWFNGFLGTALTFWLASVYLGLSPVQALISIVASNVGGLVALMAVLRLEKWENFKTRVLRGSIGTWTLFLSIYFLLMVLISPPLRDWRNFLTLLIPLILSNGFCIIAFGPLQDRIVRREQRRMKGFSS